MLRQIHHNLWFSHSHLAILACLSGKLLPALKPLIKVGLFMSSRRANWNKIYQADQFLRYIWGETLIHYVELQCCWKKEAAWWALSQYFKTRRIIRSYLIMNPSCFWWESSIRSLFMWRNTLSKLIIHEIMTKRICCFSVLYDAVQIRISSYKMI